MRLYPLTLALSPLFLDQLEPFLGVMGENVAAGTAWSKVDICESRENRPRHAPSFFIMRSLLSRSNGPKNI